jgi:ABC-type amino acid transport substrate-binding protein
MNNIKVIPWVGAVILAALLGLGLRGTSLPENSVLMRNITTKVLAQEVTPTVQTTERLVILAGGDQSYPPYEFLDKGIPDGFNIDLARSVADVMGFDIEIRLGPWSEVRQDLLDGNLDLILGMANTTDRETTYDFSVPYVYISFDLFVPANSSIRSLMM